VHSPFAEILTNNGKTEVVTEVAFQYRFPVTNDCTGCDPVVWSAKSNDWAFRNGASDHDWGEPILACRGKSIGMKTLINWLIVAAVVFYLIIVAVWTINASQVQAALDGGGVEIFRTLLLTRRLAGKRSQFKGTVVVDTPLPTNSPGLLPS
jgi:hypothetical protein